MIDASLNVKCPICCTPIQIPYSCGPKRGDVIEVTLEPEGLELHMGLKHRDAT